MTNCNINSFIKNLSKRHNEISLLIEHAKQLFEKDDNISKNLYNSICRSTSILLVSHLEGFIRDFTKNMILDINKLVDFKDINDKVKKQYVSFFLNLSENYTKKDNEKTNNLVKKFELIDNNIKETIKNNSDIDSTSTLLIGNSIELIPDPFLFKDNKNPKPDILNRVCGNFGIKNIFSFLKNSKLDIVFENNKLETNQLIEKIFSDLELGTNCYPFNIDINYYELEKSELANKEITHWEEFLNNLLAIRHKIVHGSSLENITNHTDLKDFEQKTILLQYGIILLLIKYNFKLNTNLQ